MRLVKHLVIGLKDAEEFFAKPRVNVTELFLGGDAPLRDLTAAIASISRNSGGLRKIDLLGAHIRNRNIVVCIDRVVYQS